MPWQHYPNSLTTKQQTTKFSSAKFKKNFTQAISYSEFKDYRANGVDLGEVAHDEPPHQDQRCLQIQLFSSLVLKRVKQIKETTEKYNYTAGGRTCILGSGFQRWLYQNV